MMKYAKAIAGVLVSVAVYKLGSKINLLSDTQDRDLPLAGVERAFVDIATLGYTAAWDRVITIWTLQQADASPDISTEEIYKIYMNAARLKPKSANLYIMGCAALTFTRKRHDLSIDILEKGIEVFPENWTLQSFLALSYFLNHNDTKALEHYEIASKLPNSPAYLKGIVDKFYSQGNFDKEDIILGVNKTLGEGSLQRLRDRLIENRNKSLKTQEEDVKDTDE